jgi:undecaprenyl-diphosphatase
MTLIQALILSVVEGITEYLPVSSTGHIIWASTLMGIADDDFVKDYTVIVQFGAILSVLVLYWRRFLQSLELYWKLFIAFLPAAIIGLATKDYIDVMLSDAAIVAWALIIGGFVLILSDHYFIKLGKEQHGKIEGLSRVGAVIIGFFQCLALVPGVSRSAATILGGMLQKLDRKAAAEFSFFLAVPTLTAATGLKTLHAVKHLHSDQLSVLLLGNVASFAVGLLTIKTFVTYLSRHGFTVFGVYRILAGAAILFFLHH